MSTWGQQRKFWPQRPWQFKWQKGLAETAYSHARKWRTKQPYTGVENRRKEGWEEHGCKHQVCSIESGLGPCRVEGRVCLTLRQMDTQISPTSSRLLWAWPARDEAELKLSCGWALSVPCIILPEPSEAVTWRAETQLSHSWDTQLSARFCLMCTAWTLNYLHRPV